MCTKVHQESIFRNNYTKYIDSIIKDLEDVKNICIVTLCKSAGKNIEEQILKKFPELRDKILCYTR